MERIASLKNKFAVLRRSLTAIPNVHLDAESPREGYFQTLMSRGDRRLGRVIRAIHEADGDWWRVIRAWQREGIPGLPHPHEYVHRTYGDAERLPWDFIDHRIAKSFLWVERRKAFMARQTPPCDTSTCVACAAC